MGDKPSSSALPSLVTVTERFRPIPPRKRDDLMDLVVVSSLPGLAEPSLPWILPALLMRKKFLNFCGKCPLDCLWGMEKARLSIGGVEDLEEKSCVMLGGGRGGGGDGCEGRSDIPVIREDCAAT